MTSASCGARRPKWKPHIAFNLLEGSDDVTIFDQNVVSHLELLKLHLYGLQSARTADRARQVAVEKAAHLPPDRRAGVRSVPDRARDPPAQAAFVPADGEVAHAGSLDRYLTGVGGRQRREVKERVTFIHESIGTAALVERTSKGGNSMSACSGTSTAGASGLGVPVHEHAGRAKQIATDRVKWSVKYQKKYSIDSGPANELPDAETEFSTPVSAPIGRSS